MRTYRGWLSFALCLAVLPLLPDQASAADPPPADPAIHELRPAGGADIGEIRYILGNVAADDALESAILDQLAGYDNCDADPGTGLRYFHNAVDLNDDGLAETIVYLVGRYACGSGGCTSLIFRSNGETYEPMARVTLVNNPIVVSPQTTNGWRDLILHVAGGGAPSAYHVLEHSGTAYPENPSVAPALESGAIVTGDAYIANEIGFDTPAPVLRAKGCVAAGLDLMGSEGFGALRIDLAGAPVEALLGEPETEGEPVMGEADARLHQTWRYPAQGVVLDMVSDAADGPQTIASIRIGPPSTLRTRRGIGIGDSYAAVEQAYGAEKDEENSDPLTFVAGSLYGGLVFSFEADKVSRILLGAAAE